MFHLKTLTYINVFTLSKAEDGDPIFTSTGRFENKEGIPNVLFA